jgi:hypothetical protein
MNELYDPENTYQEDTSEPSIIQNLKMPICKIEAKFSQKKQRNHNYEEDIVKQNILPFEAKR